MIYFLLALDKDQMLQKFYEKDDLLCRSLEQVLADALVHEGAKDSILATQDSYDQSVQFIDDRHTKIRSDKGKPKTRRGFCYTCGVKHHIVLSAP